MPKFILIDLNNLVKRAQFSKGMGGVDKADFATMVLHISLDTIRYLYSQFEEGHLVFCADQSSWRFKMYPEYKGKRVYDENHVIVKEVIRELAEYLKNQSNATSLQLDQVEADDLIARWVQIHSAPEYENLIISGDKDFCQLVSPNTSLYSPNTRVLTTAFGMFQDGYNSLGVEEQIAHHYGRLWKVLLDKQGNPKQIDPQYALFEKCMRGDSSDNIRSALPKVRKTRLLKAYADRGGLEWNNLINSYWGENDCNSVRECYEFNQSLIDLTKIPLDVIERIDQHIGEELLKPTRSMIPVRFGQFCNKYQLVKLQDQTSSFVKLLSTRYPLDMVGATSSDKAA